MTKQISINTLHKLIPGINQLGVEAGTNGPKGGDSGHGCRTFIRISEEGGTVWSVTVIDEHGTRTVIDSPSEIAITLGGDSELATIIKALEFALAALKDTATGATQKAVDTNL